ncbi:MAG: type II toxin-antitoxin system Phd/YefM family antitoxin [Candidatus Zixiibacteriota bacterium]|nr:MAG: type II toxin-antitoxin system Phd/YefM family antitoxin [candidate division Zixibacteria bacterium]
MEASIGDLRYHMKKILRALDRNETITVLYRGRPRGKLVPLEDSPDTPPMREHPFFGMNREATEPVDDILEELRGSRYPKVSG